MGEDRLVALLADPLSLDVVAGRPRSPARRTASTLSEKTCRSMSEPWRTWPVIVLPISRGRKTASSRIIRRASTRISRRFSVLLRALVHPGQGLDLVADLAVAGQIAGLTSPEQIRRAAFIFARKYSDSSRAYISRAASQAIWRRSL